MPEHGRKRTADLRSLYACVWRYPSKTFQQSATSTVIQRLDELSSHICFIVLLLINFYFIFYTYVHYLLTIVVHSRLSLYDWAVGTRTLFIIYHSSATSTSCGAGKMHPWQSLLLACTRFAIINAQILPNLLGLRVHFATTNRKLRYSVMWLSRRS